MKNDPRLLERLLDNSNQAIQACELENLSVLYVNKTARLVAGDENKPYEGKHCYEYMFGFDGQCPNCPLLAMGDANTIEQEIDNGKEIYSVKAEKIKWQDKDVFVEYVQDVTAVRRPQKNYEKQVQTLISSIPDAQGIFYLDIDDDKIHLIGGSSDAINYTEDLKTVDDLVRWMSGFVPDKYEREEYVKELCRDSMIEMIANGKTEAVKDIAMYYDDGSIRPSRVVYRFLTNPINEHRECVVYGLDTTKEWEERWEHEDQMKEQWAIFNTLSQDFVNVYIANLNSGIARILKFNSDYVDIPGKEKRQEFQFEEVLSKWIATAVHPDDQPAMQKAFRLSNLREVMAKQSEYQGNYRNIINGEVHHYQFNLTKMDDEGGVILGFRNTDAIIKSHIEEERAQKERDEKQKQELIAARQEAERANLSKTEFLQRMSHDIRTPLNGIQGMLDIAERYRDDLEKQAECREKVRKASKLLLGLINEVLDMNKLESGQIVLEHVPFDMADVPVEIFNVIFRQASERDIDIIQTDWYLPNTKVIGSPIHFKRVIMNILSNAIKYNKDHGKVYVTCKEVQNNGDMIIIEFICRDTGIGMSRDFQKHIFEPFAQESEGARTSYKGTGLGMPITKSLVEKMGGTLSFESEKGVGTTFTVTLPFELDKEDTAESSKLIDKEKVSIKGLKILLAEDNELNMEIAKFLLSEEGAVVTEAWNGKEAVETFELSEIGQFDAILMDVMMPIMNGHDATKAIRALDRADAKEVPIIAMTANAFAEDRIAAKKAGMNEHIAKPLEAKKLLRTIAELVAERNDKK